jgi:Ca2+-binding EF-hand superfamily protein
MKNKLVVLCGILALVVLWGTPYVSAQQQTSAKESVQAHFAAIDTNKDGKISLEEYTASCAEHFKKLDTNADGFLTKEELQETAAKAKEKVRGRFRR